MDNNIRIYSGEIDEEEDSPEIKELRVMGAVCCVGCVKMNLFFLCLPFQEAIPFAVVASTTLLEVGGKRVRGRLYPWGVVESKSLPSPSS